MGIRPVEGTGVVPAEQGGSGRRFRGKSSVYTWLHGILLNVTRHYYRSRKRIVYTDDLPKQEILCSSGSDRPDLDAAASLLTDGLQRLSPEHREVLVLRYYEEMKIAEVARHIGVSKGTVKSRLHYAIRHLRKLIPEELNLFRSPGT